MDNVAVKTNNKIQKKIERIIGRTIFNFNLIEANDRILVAVSGGKDSLCMLTLLKRQQEKSPVPFEIFAYTLDQGQPGFDAHELKAHYESLKIEYYIEKYNTYEIVKEKLEPDQTQCFLCSRLRRGILYSEAERLKANKLALGHHADDAIETLLLNMFYNGRLASIPPKLINDKGNIIVIRPLIEVEEEMLTQMAIENKYHIIPCSLCGSQENLQRNVIKNFIKNEAVKNQYLRSSMKHALKNIKPDHLWDSDYSDFKSIKKGFDKK